MVVRLDRVDWRMERRVAAVAAVAESGGMVLVLFGVSEDEDGEEDEEMTLSDCRTAREDSRPAIVDAKAWMLS